ncbi:MAG: DPP IV N-terminal domain-containing protein [Firmicutes bacterium]|nr:DPP IV N-terminal domain-containing protein [Bacillota bacterium]
MTDILDEVHDLLPQHIARLALNVSPQPHWIDATHFWFRYEVWQADGSRGHVFKMVNVNTGESSPAFDHERLARALTLAQKRNEKRTNATQVPDTKATTGDARGHAAVNGPERKPALITATSLPLDALDLLGDTLLFMAFGKKWRWDSTTSRLARARTRDHAEAHEVLSPDGKQAAFLRGPNLYVRSLTTGTVVALTADGRRDFAYAGRPDFYGAKTVDEIRGTKPSPQVIWSPDSTRLLTHRIDQRRVRQLPVMQYVPDPEAGSPRPARMRQVHYPLPGDSELPIVHHLILGLDGSRVDVSETLELANTDALIGPHWQNIWWAEDGAHAYCLHPDRGCRAMRFCEIDTHTGLVRTVWSEQSNTFLDQDMRARPARLPDVRVQSSLGTFVIASQRDGWYHLYRHDLATGRCLNAVTQGDWVTAELLHVDEVAQLAYIVGAGREAGRDPYLHHVYRVSLDGDRCELVTPQDGEHEVHMSPDGTTLVDTWSRIDQPPVTVLRRSDGAIIANLAEADVTRLYAAGYQCPQPFVVCADDGVTELHGILIPPARRKPGQKAPIIEYEYGGPQTTIVPHGFTVRSSMGDRAVYGQALAQLGFAVILLDGRGTPGRSKAFHDVSSDDLGAAAGLADHPWALRQLVSQFPWLDLDRVGMYGFSGGGYGSARAILTYPDVYKVAVASCGDHDNRLYDTTWWDRYMGAGPVGETRTQDNQSLAHRLEGKLLLMHGDIDDNVHPSLTMRLVDALIRAERDFDMLLLPNRGHALSYDPYVIRRTIEYFCRHLRDGLA